MSEEETKRVLKDLIAYYKKCAICKEDVLLNLQGITAIENILKLYNKEKEERKRLGKLYYEANENCIKYEKNYISKDKIKEKIKELEKECDKCDFKESNICEYFETNKNCTIQLTIKNLKEILNECNNK